MFCQNCGTLVESSRCVVCGSSVLSDLSDSETAAPQLSGWWRRVGASFVDEVILIIPMYVVLVLVGAALGVIVGALASIALGGFYMVKLLTMPDGQTIGNRVVSTYVRDATTGYVLTTKQAIKRWGFVALYSLLGLTGAHVGTELVGAIGLIDCLYPLFNTRKQTLHDVFAGTIVLQR